MRDFTCCERTWPTLHDLLQHYEEHHHGNATPSTGGAGPAGSRGPSNRGNPGLGTTGRMQQAAQPIPGYQQPHLAGTIGGGIGVGGIGQMMRQQHQPSAPKSSTMSHMNDEMDAVGEMELDETVGHMDMDDSQRTIQQTRQLFGQQQRPQLHLNSSGLPRQALRTSQPPTPAAASFGFQNNPTVSSVNTPTLTTQQGLPQRGQFSQDNDDDGDDLPGMPMKMNLGNMGLNTQLGGLNFGAMGTIDDPAKRLYSPGGTTQMTSQQRAFDQQLQFQQQIQQQLQSMNLDLSQLPAGTDPALILQQMTALMMPPNEEPKPFRCPVIGCEKAYKNQNGLKYVQSLCCTCLPNSFIPSRIRPHYSPSTNNHSPKIPQDPRSLNATAARERRWHVLHCQPRNQCSLSWYPRHGEGKAVQVRRLWKAIQEFERSQICQ